MTNINCSSLMLAADFQDLEYTYKLAQSLKPFLSHIKLGLEFYFSHGAKGVQKISELGIPIFLDLKVHDIPITVQKSLTSLLKQLPQISILTVHIQGGPKMLEAAIMATKDTNTEIAGVTILTSLLTEFNVIMDMIITAQEAGLKYIVTSKEYVNEIKRSTNLKVIVPGIRTHNIKQDDQQNIFSPQEALDLDIDHIVLGRTVTLNSNIDSIVEKTLAIYNILNKPKIQ